MEIPILRRCVLPVKKIQRLQDNVLLPSGLAFLFLAVADALSLVQVLDVGSLAFGRCMQAVRYPNAATTTPMRPGTSAATSPTAASDVKSPALAVPRRNGRERPRWPRIQEKRPRIRTFFAVKREPDRRSRSRCDRTR